MFRTILAAALVSVLTVGCGGDNDDSPSVRVFHASPDAPNVDVALDGGRVLENVPFSVASDFLPIDAGTRRVTVSVAGTNTAVIDAEVPFSEGEDYLIIAAGRVKDIGPIVAPVDRSAPPASSAKLRVLHSAPSAPEVDVYVVAAGKDIASSEPVLSKVPFKAISDYLTVPAGTYDVAVTVAGTKTVAIEALGFEVAEGTVATVAALDAPGSGAPFSLKVLEEQ
jgi:hypothetical protein